MDIYTQALTRAKRKAQSEVVQLLSITPATKLDPDGPTELPDVAANG